MSELNIKKSAYDLAGLPEQVRYVLFIVSLVCLISPYVGVVQFAGYSLPTLPTELRSIMIYVGPIIFVASILGYMPLFGPRRIPVGQSQEGSSSVSRGTQPPSRCVLDIGTFEGPHIQFPYARLRFTISNFGELPLKITAVILNVLSVMSCTELGSEVSGSKLPEHIVHIRVDQPGSNKITDHQFMLDAHGHDAFDLTIEGPEGTAIRFVVLVRYQYLLGPSNVVQSSVLEASFPVVSAEAMLRALDRRRSERIADNLDTRGQEQRDGSPNR